MTIQFLCPNGHRIRCPDEQAGRAAKCPRCGIKFRIPELSELEVTDSDSDVSPPDLDVGGEEVGQGDDEQIEFLCPNGHRLHGPASLQGRPGQCPECDSKFRVPSYDDVPDEEEEEEGDQQQIGVGRADGLDSGLSLEPAEGDEIAEEEVAAEEPASGSVALARPTWAGIFARLWAQRANGAVIEVHLREGQTVAPDHFAERLSRGTHGVFAMDEPDGTHTVVVVPWESIVQVVARGLEQLPNGMI